MVAAKAIGRGVTNMLDVTEALLDSSRDRGVLGPKYLAMTQRLAPLTGSSVTVMVSFTISAKEKREALADLTMLLG